MKIETYECEVHCSGNVMRIEGSGWSEEVPMHRTTENTVRGYLAQGDYAEGGEERLIVVTVDGRKHGEYTAPQIRRYQRRRGMPV